MCKLYNYFLSILEDGKGTVELFLQCEFTAEAINIKQYPQVEETTAGKSG